MATKLRYLGLPIGTPLLIFWLWTALRAKTSELRTGKEQERAFWSAWFCTQKYHITCVFVSSAYCLETHCFRVTELLVICINTYCAGWNCRSYQKYFNSRKQSLDLWLQWIFNRGNIKPCSAVALVLIPYSWHNSRLSFDSKTRHCMGTETSLIRLVRARKSLPNLTQQQEIFVFLLYYPKNARVMQGKMMLNTTTKQTGYQKCTLSTMSPRGSHRWAALLTHTRIQQAIKMKQWKQPQKKRSHKSAQERKTHTASTPPFLTKNTSTILCALPLHWAKAPKIRGTP